MDALVAEFTDGLRRGEPRIAALETVGDPDPAAAAEAFARAARHPDLGADPGAWAAGLLASARPGRGAERLVELAEAARAAGAPLAAAKAPLLGPLLGSSDFLARLLLRRPAWVRELEGEPPPAPEAGGPDADWDAIRATKYRGLLRIAARDLAGRPFPESARELSDLADRCLTAALACAARETGMPEPALLALGKLGGRELNFSSDVDVVFVYRVPAGESELAGAQQSTTLIRSFKKGLEVPTEDGFGYRVDLDLRPAGREGPLANSVAAALDYYESFGAEWERQALIRLRAVAGPKEPARAFAEGLRPFVYRRFVDPGALRAVREMKDRIENERREAGRDLEADLKEGPGGIRDVEFLTQSLQLFHGAREPELRTGNVLDALERLGRLRLLPEPIVATLSNSYVWLRRAEHAEQAVEERQVSRFPRDPVAQLRLARRMGYRDAEGRAARTALLDDWLAVRTAVRAHFEDLVLREVP